jgi:hypothetical protein
MDATKARSLYGAGLAGRLGCGRPWGQVCSKNLTYVLEATIKGACTAPRQSDTRVRSAIEVAGYNGRPHTRFSSLRVRRASGAWMPDTKLPGVIE